MQIEQSKFMRATKLIKRLSVAYLLGMACGAYGSWNYTAQAAQHVKEIALRGYCAMQDVDRTFFWYDCQNVDARIANALQGQEVDDDTAEILADMRGKAGKGKRK